MTITIRLEEIQAAIAVVQETVEGVVTVHVNPPLEVNAGRDCPLFYSYLTGIDPKYGANDMALNTYHFMMLLLVEPLVMGRNIAEHYQAAAPYYNLVQRAFAANLQLGGTVNTALLDTPCRTVIAEYGDTQYIAIEFPLVITSEEIIPVHG